MFCAERRKERKEIKERVRRQRSLPEGHLASDDAKEKPKTFKESLLAVTNTKNFEILRDGLTKLSAYPAWSTLPQLWSGSCRR